LVTNQGGFQNGQPSLSLSHRSHLFLMGSHATTGHRCTTTTTTTINLPNLAKCPVYPCPGGETPPRPNPTGTCRVPNHPLYGVPVRSIFHHRSNGYGVRSTSQHNQSAVLVRLYDAGNIRRPMYAAYVQEGGLKDSFPLTRLGVRQAHCALHIDHRVCVCPYRGYSPPPPLLPSAPQCSSPTTICRNL
jgi:hypothetical protein